MKLNAYFVSNNDDPTDGGLGVIADSYWSARKIAAKEMGESPGELLCSLKRNVSTRGLPGGVIDPIEGLKRGMYAWIDDTECPRCKKIGIVYKHERPNKKMKFGCIDCIDI